jgi:hypothetical protein
MKRIGRLVNERMSNGCIFKTPYKAHGQLRQPFPPLLLVFDLALPPNGSDDILRNDLALLHGGTTILEISGVNHIASCVDPGIFVIGNLQRRLDANMP